MSARAGVGVPSETWREEQGPQRGGGALVGGKGSLRRARLPEEEPQPFGVSVSCTLKSDRLEAEVPGWRMSLGLTPDCAGPLVSL